MFEAHNICRELLSHRLLQHNVDLPKPQAFLTDLSIGSSPKDGSDESIANRRIVQQLHEIARIKCNDHTAEILKIVRKHVGSTFFRYDASLVRGEDGSSRHRDFMLTPAPDAQTAHTTRPCSLPQKTAPRRTLRSACRRCQRCGGALPRRRSGRPSELRRILSSCLALTCT